jgi:hypothetical protein
MMREVESLLDQLARSNKDNGGHSNESNGSAGNLVSATTEDYEASDGIF